MAFDFPNIVPPDNVRVPEALTVKQGDGPLIGRFVLDGDKVARGVGIHLKFRHDFAELMYLNRVEVARNNWRPMMDTFNPEKTDLSPQDAFWVAGENEAGEIVTCSAGRLYHWTDTTLEDHAVEMFFGRDEGQPCVVTTKAAKLIRGVVFSAGATWVRPDYRRRELSHLMPRMARAFALARWPLDWTIGYVQRPLVDKGIALGYGAKHLGFSIFYPETSYGEIVLTYTSGAEVYEDFGTFLSAELSSTSSRKFAPAEAGDPAGTNLVHEVTRISSEGVRQGSSNRS